MKKVFWVGDSPGNPTHGGFLSAGVLNAIGSEPCEVTAFLWGAHAASGVGGVVDGLKIIPAPRRQLDAELSREVFDAIELVEPDLIVFCMTADVLSMWPGLADQLDAVDGAETVAWLMQGGGTPFALDGTELLGFDRLLVTSKPGGGMLGAITIFEELKDVQVLEPGFSKVVGSLPEECESASMLCVDPGYVHGNNQFHVMQVARQLEYGLDILDPVPMIAGRDGRGGLLKSGAWGDWDVRLVGDKFLPNGAKLVNLLASHGAVISLSRSVPFSVGRLLAGAAGRDYIGPEVLLEHAPEAVMEGAPLEGGFWPCIDFVPDLVAEAVRDGRARQSGVAKPADWGSVRDELFKFGGGDVA